MRYIRTLFAILFFLLCSSIPFTYAETEQRIALVIGNSAYSSFPLKNPVNDATDMAATLTKLGFSVTLKKDTNKRDMLDAIEEFGNNLKKGGVGLFYYAGHGVQFSGVNYLLPIGARINKEKDVEFEAVNAGRILAEMEIANNGLNIVILDACRDNPFGKSFRSSSRGLAIVTNAPTGTFISYSTGAGQVARDGDGRNSPYTSALIKYMQEPGVPINDVFMNVRQKLSKDSGQVPWELSSLVGKFYFQPSAVTQATATTPNVDYEAEKRKIDAERERLRQEQELEDQRNALEKQRLEKAKEGIAKKKALAEEQRRLDEERARLEAGQETATVKAPPKPKKTREAKKAKSARTKTVAMSKIPQKEGIKGGGRFVDNGDGTVTDTETGLMWAVKDNRSDINWKVAKYYCENIRLGGFTDWRMPTKDELASLYDKSLSGHQVSCSTSSTPKTPYQIQLSCYYVWASDIWGTSAAHFNLESGGWDWLPQSYSNLTRALPVRSLKEQRRFISNGDGTVTDTTTGLMWAAKDNGSDINWSDAKGYCENYRGGGYTDWRMPTLDELETLYDDSFKGYKPKDCRPPCMDIKVPNHIQLYSGFVYSSDSIEPKYAYYFIFTSGKRDWRYKSYNVTVRALPVRNAK